MDFPVYFIFGKYKKSVSMEFKPLSKNINMLLRQKSFFCLLLDKFRMKKDKIALSSDN